MKALVPLGLALGGAALWRARRRGPRGRVPRAPLSETGPRPRIVVLGAGFGGISATLGIVRSGVDADVVLVDQHNYHLFTPLLYQVAVGMVDANSITYPLRALAYENGFHFVLAEAQDFDLAGRRLLTSAGPIAFDYLVVALGSVTNYYGQNEIAERALPLKTISDAETIRNAILRSLELAELEPDADRRRRLLTFSIVGGGPTGLELAGALSALLGDVAEREYSGIDRDDVDVQVIEATGGILAGMQPRTQEFALRRLTERGVRLRLNAPLGGVDGTDYLIGERERLSSDTLVWAAGVRGNPLLERLPGERTRDNRLRVDEFLRVPGQDRVFVVGDSAAFLPHPDARPLPGTAPVAIQEGTSVAKNIAHALRGEALAPFRYQHPGNLVALGRHSAVAEVFGRVFDGLPAWLLWRAVHLMWLTGLRNRLQVLLDWSLIYLGPRQTEWMHSAARLAPHLGRNHGRYPVGSHEAA